MDQTIKLIFIEKLLRIIFLKKVYMHFRYWYSLSNFIKVSQVPEFLILDLSIYTLCIDSVEYKNTVGVDDLF
jgi:hypothetical protein